MTTDVFESFGVPSPDAIPDRRKGALSLYSKSLDDDFFNTGGLAKGILYEFYGESKACKSTQALFVAACAQKQFPNKCVVWVDAENSFDAEYAKAIGVDLNPTRFRYHRIIKSNDLWHTVRKYVESGACSLLVLDSLGGQQPSKAQEKAGESKVGDSTWMVTQIGNFATACQVGLKAMMTSSYAVDDLPVFYFINQVRERTDLVPGVRYAMKDRFLSPGGRYVKHMEGVRAFTKAGHKIKGEDGEEEGVIIHLDMSRNRHGRERKTGDVIPDLMVFHVAGQHPSAFLRTVNTRKLYDHAAYSKRDDHTGLYVTRTETGKVSVKEQKTDKTAIFRGPIEDFWECIYSPDGVELASAMGFILPAVPKPPRPGKRR